MAKKNVPAAAPQQNGEVVSSKENSTPKKPNLLKLVETTPKVEDLVKENEKLKKKLLAMPEKLEDKITFFQRKQDLIKKYNRMEKNANVLIEHREKLSELSEEDGFTNEEYFLSVNCKANYRDNDVFKFTNPVVIAELIDFVLKNMEAKRELLKVEISA